MEEAQRKVASAVAPAPTDVKSFDEVTLSARRTHAVSDQGITALQDLCRHIGELTNGANMAGCQQEYEALVKAHVERGEEPPNLCNFMLKRMQEKGAKLVETINFEIFRPAEAAVAEPFAEGAGAPADSAAPAAVPVAPRSRPLHGGYSPY